MSELNQLSEVHYMCYSIVDEVFDFDKFIRGDRAR